MVRARAPPAEALREGAAGAALVVGHLDAAHDGLARRDRPLQTPRALLACARLARAVVETQAARVRRLGAEAARLVAATAVAVARVGVRRGVVVIIAAIVGGVGVVIG